MINKFFTYINKLQEMEENVYINTTGIEPVFGILTWDPLPRLKWMQNNWHFSVYASLIYIFVIFTLKNNMKARDPLNLRSYLLVWNLFLSLFSIVGSYIMIPEMYDILFNGSFYKSVCMSSVVLEAQHWMWLFALSKIIELGDTLFIVLKKQKLLLLHWMHHVTTLIYTWYSVSQNISLGRWFVTMNFVVHSMMYFYYALRSVKYNIPRIIAMFITTIQIIQMVFGFYVSYYSFYLKITGIHCEIPMKTATFGFFLYVAFFFLFAHFFVYSYIFKPKINKKNNISNEKSCSEYVKFEENKNNQNECKITRRISSKINYNNKYNYELNKLIEHHNDTNKPKRNL